VNAVNSGGVTALMIAVADGNADMVELLLRAGANAGVRTSRGETALSIAREKRNSKIIQMLASVPAHPGA
jgi:uncharacterized protein